MITPKDNNEVERLLAEWAQVDERAGEVAAQRRRATLLSRGEEIRDYEFQAKPNDWVHRDWLRPIRFVYRNIPKDLRMQLKKRLAK
ncbi:MAG: hypothetical protein RLZZ518_1270 [Actinomycetota bacterium]